MSIGNNGDMENRIIEAARELFIEKGFTDTSMSEIAAKVGINRPGLHYYFRTKDRMFQAVFGNIVLSFIPQIGDIMQEKDKPVLHMIKEIVDIYYKLFKENPYLPLFIMKEINRDVNYLIATVENLGLKHYLCQVVERIQRDMSEDRMNTVPLRIVFMTFYGLLTVPFLTRNLCSEMFLSEEESFDDMLEIWKSHIVSQMTQLLQVKNN